MTAPFHEQALKAIKSAHQAERALWISRQVLREFIAARTRPQIFAQPSTQDVVIKRVRYLEERFQVADDTATVTGQLIKLMEDSEDRLRAFCSITIDNSFVVRDLKIIDGSNGPFVAMPSRKLTGHCGRCRHKNHLRASYCNHCGGKLGSDADSSFDSPQKLYADVAHPINSQCREMIQKLGELIESW